MKIKNIVTQLLIEYPKARNSDNILIELYIEREFSKYLLITSEYDYLPLQKLYEMNISFESITRARRAIQKEYPELQATNSVRKGRKDKEKEMRAEFGSNTAFSKVIHDEYEKNKHILNNENLGKLFGN